MIESMVWEHLEEGEEKRISFNYDLIKEKPAIDYGLLVPLEGTKRERMIKREHIEEDDRFKAIPYKGPPIIKGPQEVHLEKIKDILRGPGSKIRSYIDVSETGTGKTIIAIALANFLRVDLIVIGNSMLKYGWKESCAEHLDRDLNLLSFIIPSSSLKGRIESNGRVTQPGATIGRTGNTILIRESKPIAEKERKIRKESVEKVKYTGTYSSGTRSVKSKNTVRYKNTFYVTDYMKKLIKDGILLIIDEAQVMKSKGSATSAACTSLIRAILDPDINSEDKSYVGLLSASLLDKEEQIETFSYSLGIISGAEDDYKDQILRHAKVLLGTNRERELRTSFENSPETSGRKLLLRYMTETFSSEIYNPTCYSELKISLKNSYFTPDSYAKRMIQEVQDSIQQRKKRNLTQEEEEKIIPPGLFPVLFDFARVNVIADLVIEDLTEKDSEGRNLNKKCIIFMRFIKPIRALETKITNKLRKLQQLSDDPVISKIEVPIVITGESGKTSSQGEYGRNLLIKEFTNNPNYRIIIIQIDVGSAGISLHDKVGDFPRVSYISPTDSIQNVYQACGRTRRYGTKSDVEIHVVYLEDFEEPKFAFGSVREDRILNNLDDKSAVIESTHMGNDQINVPSKFEYYFENNVPLTAMKKAFDNGKMYKITPYVNEPGEILRRKRSVIELVDIPEDQIEEIKLEIARRESRKKGQGKKIEDKYAENDIRRAKSTRRK